MSLRVEVVAAWPLAARVVEIELPEGATVADALAKAGFADLGQSEGAAAVGIWGRRAQMQEAVRDGDRVELYRPLQGDPKETRRRRAAAGKLR